MGISKSNIHIETQTNSGSTRYTQLNGANWFNSLDPDITEYETQLQLVSNTEYIFTILKIFARLSELQAYCTFRWCGLVFLHTSAELRVVQ